MDATASALQPLVSSLFKSRRLDLHQHHPVYKTGAFCSATSACFRLETRELRLEVR
jgi:hypothetical protein